MKKLTLLILILLTPLLLTGCATCTESEAWYYARTKAGNNYQLSKDLEEARKMYDGLIVIRQRCIKWNK